MFESLDIEIGASTADAKAAIGSVKSSLLGLEGSANDAQDSMEELGDEATSSSTRLASLAATSGATATSLLGLSTAGTGASSSLTALATSAGTGATLLGGLLAVATPLAAALGTVATAAGGVATAFGTIVGSGLLAFGQAQAKTMEDAATATEALAKTAKQLKQRIVDIVAPFGRRFIPLIRDAVAALPNLVRATLEAIGPLDSFRDALRDLGGSAADTIPAVVGRVVDLGRRALPILRDLTTRAGSAIPRAFNGMVRVTRQVGPELLSLTESALGLVDELAAVGAAIIEIVEPALTALFDAINRVSSLAGEFSGDISDAFAAVRNAATSQLRRVRVFLVGTSGNGGMLNQMIREAGQYLRNNGAALMRGAIKTIVRVSTAVFKNLKIILVGKSGSGGVLGSIITQASKYYKTAGAKVMRTAFSAIGQAIGAVARDIYNALTGNGDSVLRSIIKDFVGYLKNDAVDDLMTAMNMLKDLMVAGAKGLARGFADGFGNISFQPLIESFNSVANTINGFIEGINSQFGPIDIGARVPTVSGDILEGGVSIGGGSGGSDGSSGIDFNFGGSDGSDGSGDSGSDDGIDLDLGFGSDDGSDNDSSDDEPVGDTIGNETGEPVAGIGAVRPSQLIDFFKKRSGLNQQIRQKLISSEIDFGDLRSADRPSFLDNPNAAGFGNIRMAANNFDLHQMALHAASQGAPITGGDLLRDAIQHTSLTANQAKQALPQLATGGLIESAGLATLHAGERVVPEAQVSDRGPAPVEGGGVTIEELNVNASGRREGREAGKALRDELNRFNIG